MKLQLRKMISKINEKKSRRHLGIAKEKKQFLIIKIIIQIGLPRTFFPIVGNDVLNRLKRL
jgi:hypothetical protein